MADDNSQGGVTVLKNLVVAVGLLNQALSKVLPVVQSTAASATGGAATLPANPIGFLNITLPNGTAAKVPYYS